MSSDGLLVFTEICLDDEAVFCTLNNEKIYLAQSVKKDHWNNFGNATAGTVGFGWGSPVWNIIDDPNNKHWKFDIDMTSFIDWSFVEPDYTQTTTDNLLNFGDYSSTYSDSDNNIMIESI
jgi:hypothetical protein